MGLKTMFSRPKREKDAEGRAITPVRTADSPVESRSRSSSVASTTSTIEVPPVHSLKSGLASARMQSSSSVHTSGVSSSASSVHTPPAQLSREGSQVGKPTDKRIVLFEDGRHEHHLRNARRQEKLGRMLREIMGNNGQKVGNNAVSAVPDFVRNAQGLASDEHMGPTKPGARNGLSLMQGLMSKVAKGEVEVGFVNGSTANASGKAPSGFNKKMEMKETTRQCLAEKYGKCLEVVGKGSYGIVRVAHKIVHGREQLYAVKQFRKRSSESENVFQDRLMSEFCISSSLHHANIIETLDLMKDTQGGCCQIMEYCPGGDLYSLVISQGSQGLSTTEADCFFKQILRGVVYMHSMGVAHCDLKPENILLTQDGVCKISDFGNGECFRMAWEEQVHLSNGICGSGPYIAPEEFKGKPFDPRAVDIWAMGIIYMVMRTGSYLWRQATADQDEFYRQYLSDRKTSKGYAPVEKLARSKCVYVIYSVLDPAPQRRITGKQVLNSEWVRSIRVCDAAEQTRAAFQANKNVDQVHAPHAAAPASGLPTPAAA